MTHHQPQEATTSPHLVEFGDHWDALAWRFQTTPEAIRQLNPHINPARQPTIGTTIIVPNATAYGGQPAEPSLSLVEVALKHEINMWALAHLNGWHDPFEPRLGRDIWLPAAQPPQSSPMGLANVELSHIPGRAGEAMGLRGIFVADDPAQVFTLTLGTSTGNIIHNQKNGRFIGTLSTGAFFFPGEPEITIKSKTFRESPACKIERNRPQCVTPAIWVQPLLFEQKTWTFNNITLTGEAAEIDSTAIAAERERLFKLWEIVTPEKGWHGPFDEPVSGYLYHSSFYGARRSYNGGPYSSYHEGLDFAAYRGSEVTAPAAGRVILAENLYVRGGAVILDHGLGIYSGYYHLDSVLVEPGVQVEPGTLLGTVGTTGLSTGPHLHWDILVNGEWIDPFAWRESGMGCWLSEGWGEPCTT